MISLGIAVFLTWQVLLPLGYYRAHDRRDERFAWRIFSALAIAPWRCDVRVQEFADGASAGRDVDRESVLGRQTFIAAASLARHPKTVWKLVPRTTIDA